MCSQKNANEETGQFEARIITIASRPYTEYSYTMDTRINIYDYNEYEIIFFW